MTLTLLRRRRNLSRARRASRYRFTRGRRLRLEALEDRTLLAVFNVSPAVPDGDPGSLRDAISQANANAGEDHIYLEAGTHTLSLVGTGEDSNATGDLDVTDTSGVLNIIGAGQGTTTIDAAGIDRVMHVLGAATLNISGVRIAHGRGAIHNVGQLSLSECALSGGAVGGGSAISNWGQLTMRQSIISDNPRTRGLYNAPGASADLEECTVSRNSVGAHPVGGGGILNQGDMRIINSTVSDNQTVEGPGGGIHMQLGSLEIVNCTISGNCAYWTGGGIWAAGGPGSEFNLINTTVSGNQAMYGSNAGGIYLGPLGQAAIINSTITGNELPSGGFCGGVVALTPVSIKNTIVANNRSLSRYDWTSGMYPVLSLGNNFIGSAYPDSGFIDGVNGDQVGTVEEPLDALLGPLQDNGGPTWTHALLPGSPAIDAGGNEGAPATDQRGITRPQDGDNDENFIVDIGAYELIPPAPTPQGSNVEVQPVDMNCDTTPVTVTFESVDTAGDTSLAKGDEGPDPPQGFMLGDPATYYEIETTAGYSGTITVCIDYSDVSYQNENQLKVFHYEDTDDDGEPDTWVDRTVSIDKQNDLIYAEVTSLSPFAVFEQYEIVGIEVNPDSVNLVSNGVIGVTVFTTEQFNAAAIDAASVVFAEAYAVQSALEDVDGDGDLDMVLHFRLDETNLRQVYEALVADDLDGDGVLDSSRKEVEVSLTGETVSDELFMGLDDVDLFLRGKALRELLEELAGEGAI